MYPLLVGVTVLLLLLLVRSHRKTLLLETEALVLKSFNYKVAYVFHMSSQDKWNSWALCRAWHALCGLPHKEREEFAEYCFDDWKEHVLAGAIQSSMKKGVSLEAARSLNERTLELELEMYRKAQ